MEYTFLATAAFGLEGVAANELKRMNIAAKAENGGARFEGTLEDAFRANKMGLANMKRYYEMARLDQMKAVDVLL